MSGIKAHKKGQTGPKNSNTGAGGNETSSTNATNGGSTVAGPGEDIPVIIDSTQDMREHLDKMQTSWGTVQESLKAFLKQSGDLAAIGPSKESTERRVQDTRDKIREQDDIQRARVQDIKRILDDDLKNIIRENMREFLKTEIEQEISRQVAEQVDNQFKEHIPLSLEEQAKQGKEQASEVRIALINSRARSANSDFTTENLNDTLKVVLSPTGDQSSVWPANLNSLFAYDPETLSRLLKDYDLTEQQGKENNLNRFMAHIGITLKLATVHSATEGGDIHMPMSPR